jgi:hypothetical protein
VTPTHQFFSVLWFTNLTSVAIVFNLLLSVSFLVWDNNLYTITTFLNKGCVEEKQIKNKKKRNWCRWMKEEGHVDKTEEKQLVKKMNH